VTTLQNPPQPVQDVGTALGVLRGLFERVHTNGIRYCHWKSNQHLHASMVGKTDVDILVDRRAIVPLTRILGETNFKRFVVKAGRGYPGIEDYVGFDAASGALTHVHVHYQLTLGEKFLKGHRLPWEELFLSSRILDAEHGIYVAEPNLELVVLVVRAVMKLRVRDTILELLGRRYFGGGMLRELRWLADRSDRGRLLEVGAQLVGEQAARLLPEMLVGKGPSVGQLRAFDRQAEPSLREYRLYGATAAVRQMTTREWGIIWWKVKNWYLGAATKSTRTLPQGGLTVAFLGPDGAGKSTLTGEIADWLSREVAVVITYGGSGKGSASLPRRFLQGLAALRRRVAGARSGSSGTAPLPDGGEARRPEKKISLARLVWVLSLARERRRRALQARRAKGRGMIVLSDRLPQSQFPGWNDGPRLTRWLEAGSWVRRVAARWEQAAFRLAELSPPDLVVKLHVSAEVASRRKPETPPEQLRTGIDMVRRLQFPDSTRVLELDAEQPLDQVLLQAKRAVWENI
jgi:thymidylate kinase